MKTVIETFDECLLSAKKRGYNPSDVAYWAYAVGSLQACFERREEEYERRIHELERNAALIKTPFMRRQAGE